MNNHSSRRYSFPLDEHIAGYDTSKCPTQCPTPVNGKRWGSGQTSFADDSGSGSRTPITHGHGPLDTDRFLGFDCIAREKSHHEDRQHEEEKIGLNERLRHFTWAWFTCCMSTGGLAILFHTSPYKFGGLEYIGRAVYILQLILFLGIIATLCYRFVRFPGTFTRSIKHPVEGLFVPTLFIALATVLSNAKIYGGPHCGPWLDVALRVCFWIYCALTFLLALAQYYYIFEQKVLDIKNMTPGWLLPIFAPMMAGTIAINIAEYQPRSQAMPICVAGLIMQFLGFFMFIFLMTIFICRVVIVGLPPPLARPGMFISVGPPSFTAFVIIDLARIATVKLSENGEDVEWLNLFALLMACAIIIVSIWFFCLSAVGVLAYWRTLKFRLVWWAFVFPNIGFTIAIATVAKGFNCVWLMWVSTAFVIGMTAMYIFVAINHIVALCRKKVMWPGQDEDK